MSPRPSGSRASRPADRRAAQPKSGGRRAAAAAPIAAPPVQPPARRRSAGPAIILLAALVAVAPLFWRGVARGSDFAFHLISWHDAEQNLAHGVLYPHWAASPNFGAGEPRFVFYPPLTWMCGALLGMILPWNLVPLALFIPLLAFTGLAVRKLAREALPGVAATLAGCAAIFLGYSLFSVYKRCDYAEMTGGFWIPLALLLALRRRRPAGRFWERTLDGSAAPLALVVAGAWLSNGPVALMVCYLLLGVALAACALQRSVAPLARVSVSAALGMALSSFYLVPAIVEKKWAAIEYAVSIPTYRIENSWLFAHHADPLMLSHDVLLSRASEVAVAMLVVTFAAGIAAGLRGTLPAERRWWLPLAIIPVAILFLLLPVSLPLWNWLPALRMLQFPWRWLLALEAPMAVFFVCAVWSPRRTAQRVVFLASALVFAGLSLAASHFWFEESATVEANLERSMAAGVGVVGKPEYAPPQVKFALVDRIVHDACLLRDSPQPGQRGASPDWDGEANTCDPGFHATMADPEHKRIRGTAEHAGFLILRLRYYPAWKIRVNGAPVAGMPERERGFLAVPVPPGDLDVAVDWETGGDSILGRWVSGGALLLLIALWLLERRLQPAPLS
jgi:hypothetical protein